MNIIKGSLWSTADYFLNRLVIAVATNVFIARALSPEKYGIFSTAVTVAQGLWIVADFGLTQYGVREIAQSNSDNASSLFTELLSARLFFSFGVFGAMLLFVWMLPIEPDRKTAFYLAGIYIPAYSFSPDWYLRARLKFKEIFFADFVSSVFLVASLALIVTSPDSITGACSIWALSYAVSTALLLFIVRRQNGAPLFSFDISFRAISAHVRESKFFLFNAILGNLYISIPIYLLAAVVGDVETGYFNASYRLYIYTSSIMLPISHVFYSVLASMQSSGQATKFAEKRGVFQRVIFVMILPAAIITALFGSRIVDFVYGSKFVSASWILPYFSAPILLTALRLAFQVPIAVSGNQRSLAWISFVVLFVSVLTTYYMVSVCGLAGAVYSTILSESIYVFLLVTVCVKLRLVSLEGVLSAIPVKVLPVIIVTSFLLWNWGFSWYALALAAVIYLMSLYFTGELETLRAGTAE